ncbi:MAG TPA: rRNA methyltransferase [Myxococcales bacterium]|nr:rRNA methyltransferase [Myxococcales bacterium]
MYLTDKRCAEFQGLLNHCAERRLPFRIVDQEQLRRVSGSQRHQGICVVMRPIVSLDRRQLREQVTSTHGHQVWLYLDRVGNPHNFGAIARSAAHFGVSGILVPDEPTAATVSTASLRTSEGGLEVVPVARLKRPIEELKWMRDTQGFELWATAAHGEIDLWESQPPKRLVWILGTEVTGVNDRLLTLAGARLRIGGTGAVESLNVSTAAALCLGWSWQRYDAG